MTLTSSNPSRAPNLAVAQAAEELAVTDRLIRKSGARESRCAGIGLHRSLATQTAATGRDRVNSAGTSDRIHDARLGSTSWGEGRRWGRRWAPWL